MDKIKSVIGWVVKWTLSVFAAILASVLISQLNGSIVALGLGGFWSLLAVIVVTPIAFAALYAAISFIHEAGHALAVRAVGAQLNVMAVGWFAYNFRKKRFELADFGSAEIGGFVAYDETRRPLEKWEQIAISAAGPLATALTGLLALIAGLSVFDIAPTLYVISILLFFDAVFNLMPFRWNPNTMSDGLNIYRLLSNPVR